ncbi:MAG: sugar-binding transcriptional regulator [Bacilli bacterium]
MNKISIKNEELMVRVAWEYFMNQTNQATIAAHFNLSRPTVSRLIKRAKELGIVQISIHSDFAPCLELEEALIEVYRLKAATVVPQTFSSRDIREALGEAAANYVFTNRKRFRKVAVGWGRTISQIADYLSRMAFSHGTVEEVIEMVGNFMSSSEQLQALRLVVNLAHAFGASASVLSAPALATDKEARDTLMAHKQIEEVLAKARNADLAIASLGTADGESTLYRIGLLTDMDLQSIQERGAVGEILGRYFDESGHPVKTELDDRLIGLSLAELSEVPHVMIVAGGEEKIRSILAALRGGLIDHLVTDEGTSRAILQAR